LYNTFKAPLCQKKASDSQNPENDTQIETAPALRWIDAMVQAALDEALQQDQLGKRAGQGFKDEAMTCIPAAAQAEMDPELGITLTADRVEGKPSWEWNPLPGWNKH
jgi:hypothetical protein